MAEGEKVSQEGRRRSGIARQEQRKLRACLSVLAICFAAGVVAVLAASYLRTPPAAPPSTAPPAAGSVAASAETASATANLTPPIRRQAAIMLPSAAAPATLEQLQHEAAETAAELRARYPNLAEALHVGAMLHAQFRQTAEAEKLWRRCIELSPKYEGYYVNVAAIAIDRGDSEAAVQTLQQAIDAGCSSPDVLHHLGIALTNLGRCEEAEQVINKALEAHPTSPSYWVVLGQAQLKQGKAAEAETSLNKAVELGAQTPGVYFALASACARQGKKELAAQHRERFSQLNASRPIDAQQRFQILSSAEARRTAVTILTEAATVHRFQSDSLETERLLLRAIALDPVNAASCRALADLYRDAAMLAEERVVRERLVEVEPYQFESYLNLARVCAQLEEFEQAEAALKLAIAARPQQAAAYAALAEFYLQQNRGEKARWFAQEAVRRAPAAEGFRLLAAACRMMGDAASAEAALSKARALEARRSLPTTERPPPAEAVKSNE